MKVFAKISEMRQYVQRLKKNARKTPAKIGFVPTMGALHQGHISLVEAAAKECSRVIVSIFVNPAQFGPGEDFEKYPRDHKKDIKMLKETKKVSVVFTPDVAEIYPEGHAAYTSIESDITKVLCGASREGHFKGVTTVVAKLLNVVSPDRIYLGQKDLQQAVVIRKLLSDMLYEAQAVICPIIREKDGLALSSRNVYLNPVEREMATALYKSLQMAESMIELGEKDSQVVIKEIKRKIKEAGLEIDYVEVVEADTLVKKGHLSGRAAIAAAVFAGKTRLIDNIVVEIPNIQTQPEVK